MPSATTRPVIPRAKGQVWFPEHRLFFHVAFNTINIEDKRIQATGPVLQQKHFVRLFQQMFKGIKKYYYGHLYDNWAGRLDWDKRPHDWFDIARPNELRSDPYGAEEIEAQIAMKNRIEAAAHELGINIPWKTYDFSQGVLEPGKPKKGKRRAVEESEGTEVDTRREEVAIEVEAIGDQREPTEHRGNEQDAEAEDQQQADVEQQLGSENVDMSDPVGMTAPEMITEESVAIDDEPGDMALAGERLKGSAAASPDPGSAIPAASGLPPIDAESQAMGATEIDFAAEPDSENFDMNDYFDFSAFEWS